MDSTDVIVPQPPSSTPASATSVASRPNIGDIQGASMTLGQTDEPMPKKIKTETVIKVIDYDHHSHYDCIDS